MRAITGTVVSSEPCTLTEAHVMITTLCRSADSYLESSDCSTYIVELDNAIKEHHKFLRRCGRGEQQQGASAHDAHGYEAQVEGEEKIGDRKVYLDGPHGSVEEAVVAIAAELKKSKKKKEEEPRDYKAQAGVPSHVPASPEILFEQRKKKNKEKHSSNKLLAVVKQEPDLVVEEDGGSQRMKKKDKQFDKELAHIVKQEPGLVVEELVSEKKKAKKNREMNKKHSREEGDSKGVKEEKDEMAIDSYLNSEKRKKKRGRGDDNDDGQEQGEHKKKKKKESRE